MGGVWEIGDQVHREGLCDGKPECVGLNLVFVVLESVIGCTDRV